MQRGRFASVDLTLACSPELGLQVRLARMHGALDDPQAEPQRPSVAPGEAVERGDDDDGVRAGSGDGGLMRDVHEGCFRQELRA